MDPSNGSSGAGAQSDAANRIKQTAANVGEKARQAATQQVEQGARKVTGAAHQAADTMRRLADDMQGEYNWMGAMLRQSADGVEQVASNLSGRDLSQTLSEVGSFARRQPALFLGVSAALGFALARIGKTALEQASDSGGEGYDQGYSEASSYTDINAPLNPTQGL